MDKMDIFTAELVLIFSLVIDISRYFHCRVWITSDVSIHLTSLNVPHFRNSNAYNSVIYERKHKVWVSILLVRTLGTMCTKKVQVGKDQEKAQSERDSHSKNRGGKKTN